MAVDTKSEVNLSVSSDQATLQELSPAVLDAFFFGSILEIKDIRRFIVGVRERMFNFLQLIVSGKAGSFVYTIGESKISR